MFPNKPLFVVLELLKFRVLVWGCWEPVFAALEEFWALFGGAVVVVVLFLFANNPPCPNEGWLVRVVGAVLFCGWVCPNRFPAGALGVLTTLLNNPACPVDETWLVVLVLLLKSWLVPVAGAFWGVVFYALFPPKSDPLRLELWFWPKREVLVLLFWLFPPKSWFEAGAVDGPEVKNGYFVLPNGWELFWNKGGVVLLLLFVNIILSKSL